MTTSIYIERVRAAIADLPAAPDSALTTELLELFECSDPFLADTVRQLVARHLKNLIDREQAITALRAVL